MFDLVDVEVSVYASYRLALSHISTFVYVFIYNELGERKE
jgi:hypothetical protein